MTREVLAFICICLSLAVVGYLGNQIVKRKSQTNDQLVDNDSLEGEN